MINTIIQTIKYIYEVINEFNTHNSTKIEIINDLSYSHFIMNQMEQQNISYQLNYCRQQFIANFGHEPIDDIINNHNILSGNIMIKQINFPRPQILSGDINYDYYGRFML